MIKVFRNIAAGLLVALGLALPASATTAVSTDFTDLWFNPSENGWGLNIIHQNTLIFATLYVYNADGTPRFFSASETRATGTNSYSGPLYDTRGTHFGIVPYNAGAFTATPVGTLTLTFSSATAGTLQYNVGGTTVTKSITRFAFAANNLTGNYLGGMTASSSCTTGSQLTLIFDTMQVSHSGTSITFTVNFYNGSGVASQCIFRGSYSQSGQLGSVTGTHSCSGGAAPIAGNFTISQINAQATGFSGRFTGSDQFCSSHDGYFGGLRDVI